MVDSAQVAMRLAEATQRTSQALHDASATPQNPRPRLKGEAVFALAMASCYQAYRMVVKDAQPLERAFLEAATRKYVTGRPAPGADPKDVEVRLAPRFRDYWRRIARLMSAAQPGGEDWELGLISFASLALIDVHEQELNPLKAYPEVFATMKVVFRESTLFVMDALERA